MKKFVIEAIFAFVCAGIGFHFGFKTGTKVTPIESEKIEIVMPETRYDDEADLANSGSRTNADEVAFGQLVAEMNERALKNAAYPSE